MKSLCGITFFIGLWFMGSPWELGFVHAPLAPFEAVTIGLLIAGFSLWQIMDGREEIMARLSWILIALGLWALSAPFILGYSAVTAAMVNDLVFGAAVTALAAYEAVKGFFTKATLDQEHHHVSH